ncbi:class I glutamine amidotransferase-like protein [Lactifluus volemus]|nr:class I glutamine amidotransferase-like protein [Lactifluus volemus]
MLTKTHLALLVCDIPIPAVIRDHGEYPMVFDRLLRTSLPDGHDDFAMDSYDVRYMMEYPMGAALDTYDGIIITGSAASAYEGAEWINKLVSWVADVAKHRPRIKIIGICFGHQIIARAFGGECVSNNGTWEVAITEVSLTDLGQRIFGAPTINIQQMHRDHVPFVPPSFHLLGSTLISRNQGMVRFADPDIPLPASDAPIPQIHILTLQGHPEFTTGIVKEIIRARNESGVMDNDTVEDAWSRADGRNDGRLVGKVIWEVFFQ